MISTRRTDRGGTDAVVVRLSYDEALVLSDLLDRWQRAGYEQVTQIIDPAESRLLDDLCASFEPVIDEVFADDYRDVVEAARRASLRLPSTLAEEQARIPGGRATRALIGKIASLSTARLAA
ncbi:MAG TPA: hypothetical protein VLM11_13645 [Streptosporangiaceae bacterium]|nr:hypothetical protein [Streptosporangiaceae bacterium]